MSMSAGGDGKGVTKRFYKAEDEGEYGYMRGEWLEFGMEVDTGEDGGRRVCRVYDTLERWQT